MISIINKNFAKHFGENWRVLGTDHNWNILNSSTVSLIANAFEFKAFALLDIDNLKEMNSLLGYHTTDGIIKNAINLLQDSSVVAGRWKNGDEIILFSDDYRKILGILKFLKKRIIKNINSVLKHSLNNFSGFTAVIVNLSTKRKVTAAELERFSNLLLETKTKSKGQIALVKLNDTI